MTNHRKMAYVVKIDEITEIKDADKVECASVGGWRVVVKKGEFKEGDLAVYCEIDSFVPTELAPFLTQEGVEPKAYNGVRGEILRTKRLMGVTSQGLLLPLSFSATEGDDVTGLLGIQKWEPPVDFSSGKTRGNFPALVPKTNEERFQNLKRYFETLSSMTYEVTEKLDGSSMSVGFVQGEFLVCSRNLSLKEEEGCSYWKQARAYSIEEKMRSFKMDNLFFQGELIGQNIQSNKYKLDGQDFYVFSVYDCKAGQYLTPRERRSLCERMGLKHVPVVDERVTLLSNYDANIDRADGFSKISGHTRREGVVFKEEDGTERTLFIDDVWLGIFPENGAMLERKKEKVHFKIISNTYLLQSKTARTHGE